MARGYRLPIFYAALSSENAAKALVFVQKVMRSRRNRTIKKSMAVGNAAAGMGEKN